eukprot:1161594-Pelagomonas_calceolata.AAC.8
MSHADGATLANVQGLPILQHQLAVMHLYQIENVFHLIFQALISGIGTPSRPAVRKENATSARRLQASRESSVTSKLAGCQHMNEAAGTAEICLPPATPLLQAQAAAEEEQQRAAAAAAEEQAAAARAAEAAAAAAAAGGEKAEKAGAGKLTAAGDQGAVVEGGRKASPGPVNAKFPAAASPFGQGPGRAGSPGGSPIGARGGDVECHQSCFEASLLVLSSMPLSAICRAHWGRAFCRLQ